MGGTHPIYKKNKLNLELCSWLNLELYYRCLNLAILLLYNPILMKGIKMKIRSKHNNLLNYFICNREDLSKEYVRKSEKFLKEISDKLKKESKKERKENGIH